MVKKFIGRPKVITKQALSKLVEGYAYGFTDKECALYAGISPATLYRYCEENKDFGEQKECLKQSPQMKAKMNIIKEIEKGDISLSKWILEKKEKEFNIKICNIREEPVKQSISDEDREKVEALLEANVY